MQPGASPSISPTTRGLALGLLFLLALLNYLDRFALGILLPGIGRELQLSDAELGFVAGGLFSLVYAFTGIPIGRFADRRSRRLVVAGALFLWSLMTAACGLAQNFVQLAVARILVGIGEAGATAPANALIADLTGPRHRAVALSVYAQGLPAGVLLGFLIGGMIAEQSNWRTALLFFAIPGLVLAPVLLTVLPETLANKGRNLATARADQSTAGAVISLLRIPGFLCVSLGSGLFTIVWLALLTWLPTFFTRSHHLGLAETGLKLALVLGFSQMAGLLLGGLIGDRVAARNEAAYLRLCALASLLSTPLLSLALLVRDPDFSLVLLFPGFLIGLMQGAPALAAVQSLAGASAKALGVSVYLVMVNIVGGLGSQAVGLLSDRWSSELGPSSLATALVVVIAFCGPASALLFWLGYKRVGPGTQAIEARAVAS